MAARKWLVLLSAFAILGTAEAQDGKLKLDIEPQPIRQALQAFGEQSGLQVLFRSEGLAIDGLVSPLVSGELSAQQALDRLLSHTGLRYEFINPRTVRISAAAGASAKATSDNVPRPGPMEFHDQFGDPTAGGDADLPATPTASPNPPSADRGSGGGLLDEVIVTARKRQESILNVPVVETVISQETLRTFQAEDIKDIATLVPGLIVGDNNLANGTQLSIRGIGTVANDPGVDSSVAMNVDGIQFSGGLAFQSGQFDVGQIEVLKGPQSLFFGKSSPGGVISLRTADPTDKFEVIATAGYEFEAQEQRGELILSGPVTDSLKVRLAGVFDHQGGYFYNTAYADLATGAANPGPRLGPDNDYTLRGTILWNPTSDFDARIKINDVYNKDDWAGSEEWVDCPNGISAPFGKSFLGGALTQCGVSRNYNLVAYNPAAFPGVLLNNGVPFTGIRQFFPILEMNYKATPQITLTSVTGYYDMSSQSMVNTYMTTYAAPPLSVINLYSRHDFSEEFRVNTDFAGPFNATAGAYFQRGDFDEYVGLGGDVLYGLPPQVQAGDSHVSTKTNSGYVQGRYKIVPQVEAAVGVRYTDETRSLIAKDFTNNVETPVTVPIPTVHSNTYSPEATLTYKPALNWTVFGSLKRGFKSGSFDVGSPPVAGKNVAFGDEEVEGGELGVKTRLLDGQLAMNLALYDYRYLGLQVGTVVPGGGLPVTETLNAGSARSHGVDFDVSYRPSFVSGLNLRSDLEWNRAVYTTLVNAPCYGGQTIAAGCNGSFAGGFYSSQNVSGTPLVRAPLWNGNFGADYSFDLNAELAIVLSTSNQFSSRYSTDLAYVAYQPGFIKSDLSVTLKDRRDRWEVSVIGKDLNDAITTGDCINSNALATFFGGQITGGTGRGPAGIDSAGCYMDRGRELWLRLSYKPFN
jgi:iron complex outermembrane receptor protein